MTKFAVTLAAAVCALFPGMATADRAADGRGYRARVTATGQVCVRPVSQDEATRLGVPVGDTRCQLPARWAANGLTVAVDGVQLR